MALLPNCIAFSFCSYASSFPCSRSFYRKHLQKTERHTDPGHKLECRIYRSCTYRLSFLKRFAVIIHSFFVRLLPGLSELSNVFVVVIVSRNTRTPRGINIRVLLFPPGNVKGVVSFFQVVVEKLVKGSEVSASVNFPKFAPAEFINKANDVLGGQVTDLGNVGYKHDDLIVGDVFVEIECLCEDDLNVL